MKLLIVVAVIVAILAVAAVAVLIAINLTRPVEDRWHPSASTKTMLHLTMWLVWTAVILGIIAFIAKTSEAFG